MSNNTRPDVYDVILVGAGIMSATLGTLLRKLDPSLRIHVIERLDVASAESSDAWNNAGTGHSAFCELNYTPEQPDGSIPVDKAFKIAEQFEASRQFWSTLVEQGDLPDPTQFIRSVPHVAFAWGANNVAFMNRRYDAMAKSPLFHGMEISENPEIIKKWAPLVMQGRDPAQPVVATRMLLGTDVNFGNVTRSLFTSMQDSGTTASFGTEVRDFRHKSDGIWRLKVTNLHTDETRIERAHFVFLGAGGGSLGLLEASDIPEGKGYAGFPVSGQWLRCTNPEVIAQHEAKVYGKAELGAPPMSVPHLDTRWIDGTRNLLFGPFAGFSTKFLKKGSYLDLLSSVGLDNFVPLVAAGTHNIDLTRYLVGQVLLDHSERMEMLRAYLPEARDEDWELEIAGQRVQIIKADGKQGGVLRFGTEVVTAADGSLAALLGASPGASTATAIMLDVIERCFPEQMDSGWRNRLKELIPTYGDPLRESAKHCDSARRRSCGVLKLGGAP